MQKKNTTVKFLVLYIRISNWKLWGLHFFESIIPLFGKMAENTAISHNYILTNLSGVKKFQFRQENNGKLGTRLVVKNVLNTERKCNYTRVEYEGPEDSNWRGSKGLQNNMPSWHKSFMVFKSLTDAITDSFYESCDSFRGVFSMRRKILRSKTLSFLFPFLGRWRSKWNDIVLVPSRNPPNHKHFIKRFMIESVSITKI